MKIKLKKCLISAAVLSLWLIIWELLVLFAGRLGVSLLLPSVKEVFLALIDLLKQRAFYRSCALTLLRVISGWGIGLIFGIVLSIFTHISPALNAFFAPAVHVVKATPVASFILLLLVLLKSGFVPVVTGALMSLPIVWANMTEGLNSQNKELTEMADAFMMSKKNRMLYLRLPRLVPFLSSAAVTSMGLCWKASVAAEVLCTPKSSIGAGLYQAKIYLETPSLFAWTLTVVLFSVLLEKGIKLLFGALDLNTGED